jgi:uncharacterized protein YgbK (DUF1537 family)
VNDSTTPLVGIFADDLTGALDAAAPFAARGFRTIVSTTSELPDGAENADVVSINLGTRHMAAADISERVSGAIGALATLDLKILLNKVDSTMRGNPGVELLAALNALSSDHAIFCPAYPQNNRTVEDGVLLLFGVPVAETDVGQDPLSPLSSNNVEEILVSSLTRAGVEDEVHVVAGSGGKAVADLLPVIIAADAQTESDLKILAERVVATESTAMVAGSAGVAVALADVLAVEQHVPEAFAGSVSGVRRLLIVTASQRLVVDEQINALGAQVGMIHVEVSIDEVLRGIGEESTDRIADLAEQNGVVVLKAGKLAGDVELSVSELQLRASTIVDNLGQVVRTVVDRSNPDVLIVIGGDTTSGVLEACDVTSLLLQGELQPGTVYGVPSDGSLADALLITRAGGFGDEKSLLDLVMLLGFGHSV